MIVDFQVQQFARQKEMLFEKVVSFQFGANLATSPWKLHILDMPISER